MFRLSLDDNNYVTTTAPLYSTLYMPRGHMKLLPFIFVQSSINITLRLISRDSICILTTICEHFHPTDVESIHEPTGERERGRDSRVPCLLVCWVSDGREGFRDAVVREMLGASSPRPATKENGGWWRSVSPSEKTM